MVKAASDVFLKKTETNPQSFLPGEKILSPVNTDSVQRQTQP
jgi:hypothetical protein